MAVSPEAAAWIQSSGLKLDPNAFEDELVTRFALDADELIEAIDLRADLRRNGRAPRQRPWLIDAADLLAEPDPGPTPYLIDGLIVDRALVACVGRWKTTKSYALLHLCISIATGRPAFGTFAIPTPGPVVFANEESGRAALWRRLDALARGSAVDREELRGRLMVSANARIKLDDQGWQDELVAIGIELQPRLIALDPLARMKVAGRNENAQDEMAPLIEFVRHLREETGAAVAFVHHTGHAGQHMRGSSDLESVWESRLTWERADQSPLVKLSSEHREAEPTDPIQYRRLGRRHAHHALRPRRQRQRAPPARRPNRRLAPRAPQPALRRDREGPPNAAHPRRRRAQAAGRVRDEPQWLVRTAGQARTTHPRQGLESQQPSGVMARPGRPDEPRRATDRAPWLRSSSRLFRDGRAGRATGRATD